VAISTSHLQVVKYAMIVTQIEPGYTCNPATFADLTNFIPICKPCPTGCLNCDFTTMTCSSPCAAGYEHDGVSACLIKQCNSAKQTSDEDCDDGNLANLDGCSSLCKIEEGFNCTTTLFQLTTCVACATGCATCSSSNINICQACKSGYELNGTTCYQKLCGNGILLNLCAELHRMYGE
jgi:cysteine-rich repeat protein